MARSRIKSKPQDQVGPQNLSAQREEFRLLAGEWATGHKVAPPPLLSGEDLEKWNAKLDDYVDMFISNIRSGHVERNFIKRIPTEIKKEIDEATRTEYPGASSDLTNRRTQKEKTKKITNERKTTPASSTGPSSPQGQNKSKQEKDAPPETVPEGADDPSSKFQKFGAAVQKFKVGLKSFGKTALSEVANAGMGAVVNRTEISRNLILGAAAIKSAMGSKSSSTTNKDSKPLSLIDKAFETIHGKSKEEPSMKKASAEEASGETSNKEVVDLLKQIEENTRSGKKESKKEDDSPRGKLASAISTMIAMLSSGIKSIVSSLAPLVAGLASKLKDGFGKALEYAKGKLSSKKGSGPISPESTTPDLDLPDGKKKPTAKKTLPPRDPKTGRFITKKAAEELAKQKAPTQSIMQKALTGAKNIGSKSIEALKSAGTAVTKTPLTGMAKGLGVVGAGIDVASGMGDLLEGKSQETLEGMDYLSPMRVGMFVGDKINKGVEAVSGGSSIGSLTYDAADAFSGSKVGNWFGLKSDAQKQQEAEKAIKEKIAAKKSASAETAPSSTAESIKLNQQKESSNVEVRPKLDQASQIIAAAPKESGTEAVVQASAQTAESVQKLAASVQNMSKTVVQKNESSSTIVMRNSARDHDSTFRRYLFDRAIFA